MLRASSYTIYVDLPDNAGEVLLVHGYTGAYDLVSATVARYVRSLEVHRSHTPLFGSWRAEPKCDEELQPPSPDTLDFLQRRGYLTTLTEEEETDLLVMVAGRLHAIASRHVQYIFMPTYDCNLRCAYCFQDHMRTDSAFRHLLRTMTPSLVDRIFAGLPALEAAHGQREDTPRRHRTIGFFGGEPLLAVSRPVVAYIMQRARTLGGASFWAVTNGTELEAYWDLLHPEGISHLQITLDGPPSEHDQRRIRADGTGTWAVIAGNLDRALAQGVMIQVRINLDRNNLRQVPALAAELVARGWAGHAGFSAYAAPITASEPETDRRHLLNSWTLNRALRELRLDHPEVAVIATADDTLRIQTRKIFSGDPAEDPLKYNQSSFCSAHTGMYIFDALGDIYACWERTGDARIRIGQVSKQGEIVLNPAFQLKWRSRTVATNPICRSCRYALHCGGGCAVLAEAQNGGFFTNHCDGYAQRFRAAVADAYLEHSQGAPLEEAAPRICDQ